MNRALFYLYWQSLANSLRQRVVRLKRPKYLFGAIFGAMYFYMYFYRFLFLRGRMGGHAAVPAAATAVTENIAALILFVAVLGFAWVLPAKRTALIFSGAEIALLFPAPLTRQELIRYKLLTSQIAIFVFALLMTLVTGRGATGRGWLHLAGWWVIISTFSLHRLAASFALTRLMERGMANWQRRAALLLGVTALAGALWAWRAMAPAPPGARMLTNRSVLLDYVESLLLSGPGPWLLLPFRTVIRPYFATDGGTFLKALLPALGLLLLHYWWVMRADVSFEEASVAISQKRAALIAARQKGNLRVALAPRQAREAAFHLSPMGFKSVAFVWKAMLYSGGRRTLRFWMIFFLCTVAISGAWMALRPADWLAIALCLCGGAVFLFVLLANITGGASYLRQDLEAMDLLQTYPVRGWQALLGQLGAQAAMGALIQWAAVILVALGVLGLPEAMRTAVPEALMTLASAALLAPPFNLAMMLVPAGALLLWPGWFRAGPLTAGFEATGLRLILLFGQLLAVLLALLLPALAGAAIWWGAHRFGWSVPWIPGAALAAATLLSLEAWGGIVILGALFERFDVSAE